jgi:hypothetical protein
MCRAIAEARKIDEVKDIRDKALAIRMYARQAQNTEAEEQAREIRLRAERKCGQMTAQPPTAQGQRSDLTSDHAGSKLEALSQAGISRRQATAWERLAAVPEDLFEQALAEPNPSTAGIITRHEVAERGPLPVMGNHMALWVWGTLQDLLLRRPEGQLGGRWVRHRVSRHWTRQASSCHQRWAEVLVCPRRAALRVRGLVETPSSLYFGRWADPAHLAEHPRLF